MKKKEEVYEVLVMMEKEFKRGISAKEIGKKLCIDRSNISRYLNTLYKEGVVEKIKGRPVLYKTKKNIVRREERKDEKIEHTLEKLVEDNESLHIPIQQAKAAILYPPKGLHTLILGETGVGKSMFAEMMYLFSKKSGVISEGSPFIRFNCADYTDNPQLLIGQIFGVKKGAYTGADKDKEGLMKKAHGGILFLDEIHRLSHQGQEMLFLYIDKGYYRPLGETEKVVNVDVHIIAATTEKPESYLLKTFTRRIPMTITLPPLRERSINERYNIIKFFIKEESKRVGNSIYINRNSLISLLLYNCPNNIGQLQSDIQLSCAKAFLAYKSNRQEYILITQLDIPSHVKKGLMSIKHYRKDIDKIIGSNQEVFKFYYKEKSNLLRKDNYKDGEYFYDLIEQKLESLKSSGMEENQINDILNVDIENYFRKYINNLPNRFRKDEIVKVVDEKIIDLVEKLLKYAGDKLNKEYDEKIYFGLALHLQRSIQRIKNGDKIYHPKLNFIRVNYTNEFFIAMEITKEIDKIFNIETPLDEIGYLAMFLSSNPYRIDSKTDERVNVIVVMHGDSTATSMTNVANNLVGTTHAISFDMPLSMKTETMYEIVKKKVVELDNNKGILLLVDMGSLTNFGNMIYEETGKVVKTIDMVSTATVIEACRKSILGRELNEIYKSCIDIKTSTYEEIKNTKAKENIIISACFTGEGASEKLKEIIKKEISSSKNVKIITLDILSRREFINKINNYKKDNRILAIVGTVEIHIEDIPFISAVDILVGSGIEVLKDIINREGRLEEIGNSLTEHLSLIDGMEIINKLRIVIDNIEEKLKVKVKDEVKLGIILHMSFLIDKLKKGEETSIFKNLQEFSSQYNRELSLIKETIKDLEDYYKVSIKNNELAYLCKMFIENNLNN
ncbi:sigma 54-interacting transcriptional regulator [Dethiothermospora halolimnae]|uniref:sigma-54-dependent transcriptional regulator n=1 Tax=Dethiothermospora halolimnae TaxID=3114390 RepID=UPI003CCBCB16